MVADRITLKGDKRPTVPVLVRRAIGRYLEHITQAMHTDSQALQIEVEALDRSVTPVPQPSNRPTKGRPQP
jgi:hypothetical protein